MNHHPPASPATLLRTLQVSRTPSPRVLRAVSGFGLAITRRSAAHAADQRRRKSLALLLDARLKPGEIAFLSGPSGCGKSRLLSAWRRLLPGSITCRPVPPTIAAIDALPAPLPAALDALSRAGLADAQLLPRLGAELSGGEAARLSLAIAITRAQRRLRQAKAATIFADEFLTPLDRPTAHAIAMSLAPWTRRTGVRLICAAANDDLAPFLRPNLWIRLLDEPHAPAREISA
ncbi:MAG: AAA family ATPase [Tepidisphaera sp.]|nr:AAA family ATPase [Tepidisphaera sp.]